MLPASGVPNTTNSWLFLKICDLFIRHLHSYVYVHYLIKDINSHKKVYLITKMPTL